MKRILVAAAVYPPAPSPQPALGSLFSFSILGATALRFGKSRQHSQNRLITNCLTTAITTDDTSTDTVTIDSPVQELSNSPKDRYAPPHTAVMVC